MDFTDNYAFCRQYMVGDEYILWKGHPEKGNIFTGRDAIMIPFSLIWLSFACFWELTALRSGAPVYFALFGLPFVGIGLYMLFGRFISAAYFRDKTFYVITNRKILIKRGKRIKIYNGTDLPPMDITIHKNGNGTILFSETVYTRRGRSHRIYFALENLKDVAQAQNAITMMEQSLFDGTDFNNFPDDMQ